MQFMTKATMQTKDTKYELLKEQSNYKRRCIYVHISILLTLCIVSSVTVYMTWSTIYDNTLKIPPKLIDIPQFWVARAITYSNFHYNNATKNQSIPVDDQLPSEYDASLKLHPSNALNHTNVSVIRIDNETIYPSQLGKFIPSSNGQNVSPYLPADGGDSTQKNQITPQKQRLVCYYQSPAVLNHSHELYPKQIDPKLCTHINVGIVNIENNTLVIDNTLGELFKQMSSLRRLNSDLKVMMWIGGPSDSLGFIQMIENHANRKEFIKSVKAALMTYRLDGIDLDWEFPITSYRRRLHFSQLLHEIRREYEREQRTYILSVAVAAPEGIAYFAYDIGIINENCDFVNIMTYDYHFYSKSSPFTGLNAPLYRRHDEHSVFATLNINASVSYWQASGLDKEKIVVGLPTYGHSFRLVNPINAHLGAPASGYGRVGSDGFVTYSDVCWFDRNNYLATKVFDTETCSPYIYAIDEWISYEDERSISCKANYVKEMGFGGVMIFSLNTDDYSSYCNYGQSNTKSNTDPSRFPLTRLINTILL